MVNRPAPPALQAWELLLHAQRALVDTLEAELRAAHGLALREYEVLMRLAQAPEGRLRMGELAGSLLFTPGGISRLADRLEGQGLLTRRPCPDDRRGIELALTSAGRRRMRAAARDHLDGVQRHFARHFDPDEAAQLGALLARVAVPQSQPQSQG